jgi:hypothetical protein
MQGAPPIGRLSGVSLPLMVRYFTAERILLLALAVSLFVRSLEMNYPAIQLITSHRSRFPTAHIPPKEGRLDDAFRQSGQ